MTSNVKEKSCPAVETQGFLSRLMPGLPWGSWFIIGMELCERFTYWGLLAILPFYLKDFLGIEEHDNKTLIHLFVFFAFTTSVGGAIISDSVLGKFKTITYLSTVYVIGVIVLAVTAIPDVIGESRSIWGVLLGLFLIGVGTGGIKPCVSSFGGDLMDASETTKLSHYFSLFYFAINVGSFVSMFITPVLREEVHCFGLDSCYPLAFGVPALFMILAFFLFLSGYTLYNHLPPTQSIFLKVIRVIYTGIKTKFSKLGKSTLLAASRKSSILDYAKLTYSPEFVDEVKVVLNIVKILVPVICWWAINCQQASTWPLQAELMNRDVVFGNVKVTLKPEHISLTNPILILLLIPLFTHCLYPFLRRCGCSTKPIAKMIAGFILIIIASCLLAVTQYFVDQGTFKPDPTAPKTMICVENCVSVFWQLPMYVISTASEVIMSVTCLEFAYAQAPSSMRSVCSAFYLLTVAFGNLLVMLISCFQVFDKANMSHPLVWESLFYSLLCFIVLLIFIFLSKDFTYAGTIEVQQVSDEDSKIVEPDRQ